MSVGLWDESIEKEDEMIVVSVYFDELKSRKSGVMFELYIYIFT
jgi:hypothetical protein